MVVYVNVYSRSTSFLICCLNRYLLGDLRKPFNVCHHDLLTDDRTIYATHLELLDLPGLNVWSSSPSESMEYNFKNARISTVSSIIRGR